jgi:hypothetical protein
MTCPECNQSFETDLDFCPRCGISKGVIKTSTILISTGEMRRVYRSVDDVPGPLRRRLIRSTNGLNSATIVIADRRGRKEIAKAIRNLPGSAVAKEPPALALVPPRSCKLSPAALQLSAVMLFIAVASLAWVVFR